LLDLSFSHALQGLLVLTSSLVPHQCRNGSPDLPGIALVSISRLSSFCETLAPEYATRARFFSIRQGYGAAVDALQEHISAGTVDVILAAGSNGAYLRDHLQLPVVLVKVNGFDVLSAITRAISTWPGEPIGLVLHETVSSELTALNELLNLNLRQHAYRSIEEVQAAVSTLAADGYRVIIGPGAACDFAQLAGLHSVFLYSLRAVDEAFERSVELARVSRQKEAKRLRLNTIVAHLRDGVAAFDDAGNVEAANPAIVELLALDRTKDVPAQLARIVGHLLRETFDTNGPVVERIEHIGGRTLTVNCAPIFEHGIRVGGVVTVQDTIVAQRIDRSLRTSQRPKHLVARHKLSDLTGTSPALQRVRRLARAGAAQDATVLIVGESGTGKELVAQGIHNESQRRGNPFVAFNCAALPEGLIESELFGHEEGAFTGARRGGKPGLFEIAHTGTIFLDEIGEMPSALQSRLLRVLQEREVMKIGSGHSTPIDVRVIAATHRDLHAEVTGGTFRADLYFRLNLLQIALPPLRHRREDIAALASQLIGRIAVQYGLPDTTANHILQFLTPLFDHYAWPGNVRELENLLARAALYTGAADSGDDATQDLRDIFPEFGRIGVPPDTNASGKHRASQPLERIGPEDIQRALQQYGGNRAAASRALGIGRTTLWRLMKK